MPIAQLPDSQLFYRVDDCADPWAPHDTVMLQHGLGRSGNMYYGWVPHLSRDFRVVRMDLRGLAQSPDPGPQVRYTLDGFMSDFIGLLDELRVDKVHYVGESLGGILGIALAALHPDRVKSLTLVSTILRVRQETTVTINSLGYPSWAEAIADLGMKQWWLRSRKATGELTGNAAKDNWFAEECGRTASHVAQILTKVAPTLSVASLLDRITAPTLLLSPGNSKHTDPQEQQTILDGIARSRQIIYPDGKHIDCYLRPDGYARDTLAFLREVSPPRAPSAPSPDSSDR